MSPSDTATPLAHLGPTDPERRILRNGTFNARDAGNYPIAEAGGWMRTGTLFRSDALAHLDRADLAEAERLGISLVVDLRDPHERDNAVDVEIPQCVNASKMLFEGRLVTFPADDFPKLPALYEMLLTTHIAQVVDALEHIASVLPRPVIVHCTAGKDRTGIIVALLQSLAGVDPDIILEDYAASELLLADGFTNRVHQLYDRAGVDRRVIGPEPIASPSHYLGEALHKLATEHGSIENFLLTNHLTPEAVARIRSGLIEPHTQASSVASPR